MRARGAGQIANCGQRSIGNDARGPDLDRCNDARTRGRERSRHRGRECRIGDRPSDSRDERDHQCRGPSQPRGVVALASSRHFVPPRGCVSARETAHPPSDQSRFRRSRSTHTFETPSTLRFPVQPRPPATGFGYARAGDAEIFITSGEVLHLQKWPISYFLWRSCIIRAKTRKLGEHRKYYKMFVCLQ